jgi:hypothetical protein
VVSDGGISMRLSPAHFGKPASPGYSLKAVLTIPSTDAGSSIGRSEAQTGPLANHRRLEPTRGFPKFGASGKTLVMESTEFGIAIESPVRAGTSESEMQETRMAPAVTNGGTA